VRTTLMSHDYDDAQLTWNKVGHTHYTAFTVNFEDTRQVPVLPGDPSYYVHNDKHK